MSTIKSRKAKGRLLQNYVSKRCTEFFEMEEGDFTSQIMGMRGRDVVLSPAAKKVCCIAFECKATDSAPGTPDLTQAKYNAEEGENGVVVWKPKGKGPDKSRVIMDFEDLLKIIDFYWKLEPRKEKNIVGNE